MNNGNMLWFNHDMYIYINNPVGWYMYHWSLTIGYLSPKMVGLISLKGLNYSFIWNKMINPWFNHHKIMVVLAMVLPSWKWWYFGYVMIDWIVLLDSLLVYEMIQSHHVFLLVSDKTHDIRDLNPFQTSQLVITNHPKFFVWLKNKNHQPYLNHHINYLLFAFFFQPLNKQQNS